MLISHKGDYHYVVMSVRGSNAKLLWIERVAGEPIRFYTYKRDVAVHRAPSYYDVVKQSGVNRNDYRTPPDGWPAS